MSVKTVNPATEEVLREYIRLVDVRKRGNKYGLSIVDIRNNEVYKNKMLVLVDGVPEFNINKIIAYDPLKIKQIKVANKQYYANGITADGIITFQTYNGDLDGFKFDPNTVEFSYDGLQLKREFYSPKYITDDEKNSRKPDFRNVLLWQPEINTGDTGASSLSFFTSDLKGNYTAVVEGIDDNGNTVYNSTDFQVK